MIEMIIDRTSKLSSHSGELVKILSRVISIKETVSDFKPTELTYNQMKFINNISNLDLEDFSKGEITYGNVYIHYFLGTKKSFIILLDSNNRGKIIDLRLAKNNYRNPCIFK